MTDITKEEKRELIDTFHRLAIAQETTARLLFQLLELLRAVDIPPANQD
jgi:hypothetical protein